MNRRNRWMSIVAALTLLAALPLVVVRAKDGRDFAGSYELRDVVDQGDQINGRFVARVFNYSDGDILGAMVLLEDSLLPGDPYAQWQSLTLFDRESVRVEAWVTLPQREFEQWQRGLRPLLWVEYHDQADNTFRSRVELIQDVVGDGN